MIEMQKKTRNTRKNVRKAVEIFVGNPAGLAYAEHDSRLLLIEAKVEKIELDNTELRSDNTELRSQVG